MPNFEGASDRRDRSRQQLQRHLDRTTDGVYVVDTSWTVRFWNRKMVERTGITVDEAVGTELWELFHEIVPTALKERYRTAMNTGEPAVFEQYMPEPLDCWLEIRAFPGDQGLSICSREITEQVKRTRELERQQFLFERAQQLSDMGVWELDLETEEVWWSEGARRIHGIGEKMPKLTEVTSFYHPDDRELVREAFWNSVESGGVYEIEPRILRDDGTIRNVNVRGEVIIEDGEATMVRGVIQDITEKKRVERELRRQNERLDEFIGVVAHDVRNPLTIAKGFTEMTQETGEISNLDRVTTALDRIDRLVADLLTLARSGRQPQKMEPLELEQVVRSAWAHVDVGDARLVVRDDLGTVTGHSGRLLQLFENLFRNSVEHGARDVTVEVGSLDGLGFYVADDGPGVPPAERVQIFEYGHTAKEGGTGFGLSIVADVATLHGYGIEVCESESGGARFEFHRR